MIIPYYCQYMESHKIPWFQTTNQDTVNLHIFIFTISEKDGLGHEAPFSGTYVLGVMVSGVSSFRVVLNDQRLWTWPGPKNSYCISGLCLKMSQTNLRFQVVGLSFRVESFWSPEFRGLVFRPKQLVSTPQAYFKSLPSLRLPAKRGISFFLGGGLGDHVFFSWRNHLFVWCWTPAAMQQDTRVPCTATVSRPLRLFFLQFHWWPPRVC